MSKYEGKPYHVVLFKSRNKDNAQLEGFSERRKEFLTQKAVEELEDDFTKFVEEGLSGEISRFYYSVNSRDSEQIHKNLLHYLIDHPNANLVNIERLIVSSAMKSGTAETKHWLFDFDEDKEHINEFLEDVKLQAGPDIDIRCKETLNGYAVVVNRGFDTRNLLVKWKNVSLKRDAMLFVDAKKKHEYKLFMRLMHEEREEKR